MIKHFPGLGNTTVDTHAGIPVLKTTLPQIKQFELIPYTYAIERVDESVRRILKLKFSFDLDKTPHPRANIIAMNAKFNDLMR